MQSESSTTTVRSYSYGTATDVITDPAEENVISSTPACSMPRSFSAPSTDLQEMTPQPSPSSTPRRRVLTLTKGIASDDMPSEDSGAKVLTVPTSLHVVDRSPYNLQSDTMETDVIGLSQSASSQIVLESSTSVTAKHSTKTVLWVFIAALTSVLIGFVHGREVAFQFTMAYIVEYSLSVDNLFVFLLIFRYFRVPLEAQETVLSYGILGAVFLRGILIVCGKELVNRFEWLGLFFAALLIYSAGKLLFEDEDDDADLDGNRIVLFAKSMFPVSDCYTGDRFFVRENSHLLATPLMVVLVTIELSDVVFAVDSVPAVLGMSKDTFVIYTSNIMAIIGLRSLFFVLSSSIGNLRFLKQTLAIVLGFIGIKMIAGCFGHDFSTAFSLCFVIGVLVVGILCSLILPLQPQLRLPSPDVGDQAVTNNV